MKSSLRLAGAAVLCASLLLTACAKKDASSSTTSTTDATKTTTTDTSVATATPGDAGATPAADATTAPADASAATAAPPTAAAGASATTAAASSGGMKFIEIPVYPGSAEMKDQDISVSSNGSSVAIKVYTTKDDTKRVIDWYKAHLPASWKNFQLSSGDKTTGTFANEGTDGDQTVLIATQDDKTTRVQLSTKHGK